MTVGGAGIGGDGFEAFWSRERDRLYRAVALTVGDAGLAAEAVDEAMARAFERWERVGGYQQPAGWVYRVAVNWARSWRRKLARRPTRPRETLDGAQWDPVGEVELAQELAGLDRKHRQVVVARYYLQLTPTEIAELLALPVGTVKSRLHRALDTLRAGREALP